MCLNESTTTIPGIEINPADCSGIGRQFSLGPFYSAGLAGQLYLLVPDLLLLGPFRDYAFSIIFACTFA
jgi:hypothetical protein